MHNTSAGKADYYDADYHLGVHSRYFADDKYYWARAEAAARLNFRGIDVTPETKILEFGCGYGQNIACLPNAWGYDISRVAYEEAQKHGVRLYESVAEIPCTYFDVVLSRHCLEHIEDPLGNLRLLLTFLNATGRLILILPKEGYTTATYEPDIHQHLYCWNFRTINNLLYRAGYEVLVNRYQSVVGYKALLPIRRLVGNNVYYWATMLAGRLWRVTELVVHAHRRDTKAYSE